MDSIKRCCKCKATKDLVVYKGFEISLCTECQSYYFKPQQCEYCGVDLDNITGLYIHKELYGRQIGYCYSCGSVALTKHRIDNGWRVCSYCNTLKKTTFLLENNVMCSQCKSNMSDEDRNTIDKYLHVKRTIKYNKKFIIGKRKRNKSEYLKKTVWNKIKEDFNYCCAYCGQKENEEFSLQADHVVPYSKGGKLKLGNIVPACSKRKGVDLLKLGCNQSKHKTSLNSWLQLNFKNYQDIYDRVMLYCEITSNLAYDE